MKSIHFHVICLMTLLLISAQGIAQVKVNILLNNGENKEFSIPENGRIYFDEENLLIDELNENPVTILRTQIRNLTFPSTGTDNATLKTEQKGLNIYPNPARDLIQITNTVDQKLSLILFSTDGQTLLSGEYNANENIDISFLPKGFYLAKIDNNTVKLIKL
ncbi:MAG: T9SS type A sorting domain-containing protein [Dysgonamonadaceae bacterium]|nr:T9SS type A sorting domain-containing protein [Dysgonamonadaceae bacterium]